MTRRYRPMCRRARARRQASSDGSLARKSQQTGSTSAVYSRLRGNAPISRNSSTKAVNVELAVAYGGWFAAPQGASSRGGAEIHLGVWGLRCHDTHTAEETLDQCLRRAFHCAVILWTPRRAISAPKKCHRSLTPHGFSPAFQADDEGSIPFTRSNSFNDLPDSHRAILTSVLLLILTNCPPSVLGWRAVSSLRLPPAACCAWRSVVRPSPIYADPAP